MVLCGLRAKGPLPGTGLRPSLPCHMACGRRRLSRALAMTGRLQARLLREPRSDRVRRPVLLWRTGLRPFTPARRLSRGILVEVVSSVMCRPPAIHSSPEAEPWDPFVCGVSGDPGLDVDGLHVFGRTSAWCDFCGLPFLRTGRGTVSHLAGDTAAHEVGPRAAGVAVCECGVGCA